MISSWLLKIFQPMIREGIRRLLIYALEKVADLASDENIDDLEREVRKEANPVFEPVLDVLFEVLRSTDDVAKAAKRVLEKVR